MSSLETEKNYFLTRLDHFMQRIENAKNEFDIPSYIENIRELSAKSHERMCRINNESLRPY